MAVMHPHQPKHLSALEQAQRVRLARAGVRHAIARCELELADALKHPAVATMALVELLRCQRGYGPARAEAACEAAEIRPGRHVGDLTARQRDVIVRVCS